MARRKGRGGGDLVVRLDVRSPNPSISPPKSPFSPLILDSLSNPDPKDPTFTLDPHSPATQVAVAAANRVEVMAELVKTMLARLIQLCD